MSASIRFNSFKRPQSCPRPLGRALAIAPSCLQKYPSSLVLSTTIQQQQDNDTTTRQENNKTIIQRVKSVSVVRHVVIVLGNVKVYQGILGYVRVR